MVNIGTSKTRNLPLDRPSRVIVAASNEQKGLTRVSVENGRADRLCDEIPDARRRIPVRAIENPVRTSNTPQLNSKYEIVLTNRMTIGILSFDVFHSATHDVDDQNTQELPSQLYA